MEVQRRYEGFRDSGLRVYVGLRSLLSKRIHSPSIRCLALEVNVVIVWAVQSIEYCNIITMAKT